MNNPPVTLGVDPAAPNGDHSAMVVMHGNRIQQNLFNALHSTDPVKLQGTVTGRITFGPPPLWNLPKMDTPGSDPRQYYWTSYRLALFEGNSWGWLSMPNTETVHLRALLLLQQ